MKNKTFFVFVYGFVLVVMLVSFVLSHRLNKLYQTAATCGDVIINEDCARQTGNILACFDMTYRNENIINQLKMFENTQGISCKHNNFDIEKFFKILSVFRFSLYNVKYDNAITEITIACFSGDEIFLNFTFEKKQKNIHLCRIGGLERFLNVLCSIPIAEPAKTK